MTKLYYPQLSHKILDIANKVYHSLGYGLPECCYQGAMMIEFKRHSINAVKEYRHLVYYEGERVGYFYSDIVVEKSIILELKSVRTLNGEHKGQLLNYLRIGRMKLGFILNFGAPSLQFRRLVI